MTIDKRQTQIPRQLMPIQVYKKNPTVHYISAAISLCLFN